MDPARHVARRQHVLADRVAVDKVPVEVDREVCRRAIMHRLFRARG